MLPIFYLLHCTYSLTSAGKGSSAIGRSAMHHRCSLEVGAHRCGADALYVHEARRRCTSAARRNLRATMPMPTTALTHQSSSPWRLVSSRLELEPKASALAQSTPRSDSLPPRPAAQHRVSLACPCTLMSPSPTSLEYHEEQLGVTNDFTTVLSC
jgi:hypothetical protein